MTVAEEKKSLRARFLAARQKISREEANAAALALGEKLLEVISVSSPVVAAYRPIRGEIDPAGAFPELLVQGHAICLPVVTGEGEPLIFRRWEPGNLLIKGAYGVEIPADDETVLVPDAVIVPLVAFDARGYRLGYGAGYYDRTIHQLRQRKNHVQMIGVAFAAQQIAEVPADPHDEKLDIIVTEKTVIRLT